MTQSLTANNPKASVVRATRLGKSIEPEVVEIHHRWWNRATDGENPRLVGALYIQCNQILTGYSSLPKFGPLLAILFTRVRFELRTQQRGEGHEKRNFD